MTTSRRWCPSWPRSRPRSRLSKPSSDGPQDFYEVNATPQLVNLFVATDDGATATAYVYLDGELQPPAPPGDARR